MDDHAAATHGTGVDEGRELGCRGRGDHPTVDAKGVLQLDARLVAIDVGVVADEEQIADLLVADVHPEVVVEAAERDQAARAECDVGRIGELRTDAAEGLAG